jgi:hypothetical protein
LSIIVSFDKGVMKIFSINSTRKLSLFFSLFFLYGIVHHSIYARTPVDSKFFAGGIVSYHDRTGEIDLGDGRLESVSRNPLCTFGLVYGKNFMLPAGLRLQLPFLVEYGAAKEWTIEDQSLEITDDNTPYQVVSDVDLYSVVYHVGCRPMVQAPVRLTANSWAYGSIGGGVHYVAFAEEARKNHVKYDNNTKEKNIRMTEKEFSYLEGCRHVSFSASAGVGLEIRCSEKLYLSLQYAFVYWEPVNRQTARDLFPLYTKPLDERFFTHSLSAVFYLARRR